MSLKSGLGVHFLSASLMFLLLLTPLLVASSLLFPFITGKAFFFRIVVELALALWLFLLWLNPSYRPKRSWLLVGVSSLVVAVLLATIFSLSPYLSFWSNYERMEGLVSYLHLLAYFLILISVFKTEKIWRWFFRTLVGVSIVLGIYSLFQLAGWLTIHQGGVRLDATLGNAIYLAVYMLIHVFLTAWLWSTERPPRRGWAYLYAGALVLQLLTLYYTATRGAILGLLAGVLFLLVFLTLRPIPGKPKLRRWAAGLLLVAVLASTVFWFGRQSNFVKSSPVLSRFADISLTETTTESRLTIWRMALRGAKERPILGWGPENFSVVFSKYYEPKLWRQEPWFDRSHNIFLDWLISTGVVGLAAYLALFLIAVYYLWRRASVFLPIERAIFSALLLAYLINNIFVFDNLTSYLLFFALLAYFHFRVSSEVSPGPESKMVGFWSRYQTLPAWLLTPVVIVGFSLGFYFLNLKPILASNATIQALISSDPKVKVNHFEQALGYKTFGGKEINEQIFSSIFQLAASTRPPAESEQQLVRLALDESSNQVKRLPQDTRLRLFYGTLLIHAGQVEAGLAQLKAARQLAPRKQQIIFALVQVYQQQGDLKQALVLAREAYDSDPNYPTARDTYINAAALAEDFVVLPQLWSEKVKTEPQELQNWYSWAASEIKLGRRDQAIEILNQTMNRFPDQKEQIDLAVKDIRAGKEVLVD